MQSFIMKYFVVLIFALVAVVTAEWGPLEPGSRLKVHRKCFSDSGVAVSEIKNLFEKVHSDDKNLHEYVLCVFKNVNVFSDERGIEKDKFIDHLVYFDLDKATATEIVNKCVDSNEQKSSNSEWAYRTMECMLANRLEELTIEAGKKAGREEH